jgi:hypothetical protein
LFDTGVRFLGRGDLAGAGVALLAEPFFAAVVEETRAQAAGARARRAEVFQIRELHGHFLRKHAALRMLLAAPDVLLHPVHAFHERFAGVAVDFDDAAFLAAVIAGNHLDCVTTTD